LSRGKIARVEEETLSALPQGVGEDEILLIWRTLPAVEAGLEALRATLDPAERAAAARYHFERDRARAVVSRGTLRGLLGALLGRAPAAIELGAGEQGKPFLRGGELSFNVSHGDEHLLVGITSKARALGVDVEGGTRTLDVDELAPTVFTPLERAALARYGGADRRAAFLRAWTRKEAYLKARAVGLSLPLKDFSVSLDEERAATLTSDVDPAEAARFTLCALTAPPAYAAAACWDRTAGPVVRLRTVHLPPAGPG
jgi:4'-phosphopantetheinyl transferase